MKTIELLDARDTLMFKEHGSIFDITEKQPFDDIPGEIWSLLSHKSGKAVYISMPGFTVREVIVN